MRSRAGRCVHEAVVFDGVEHVVLMIRTIEVLAIPAAILVVRNDIDGDWGDLRRKVVDCEYSAFARCGWEVYHFLTTIGESVFVLLVSRSVWCRRGTFKVLCGFKRRWIGIANE